MDQRAALTVIIEICPMFYRFMARLRREQKPISFVFDAILDFKFVCLSPIWHFCVRNSFVPPHEFETSVMRIMFEYCGLDTKVS